MQPTKVYYYLIEEKKTKQDYHYHCVWVFEMFKYLCEFACVYFAIGHLKGASKLIGSPYDQALRAAAGRLGRRALRLPCERLRIAITHDEQRDNAVHVTPSEGGGNPCLAEARQTRRARVDTFTATHRFEADKKTKRKTKKPLQSRIRSGRIRLWWIH